MNEEMEGQESGEPVEAPIEMGRYAWLFPVGLLLHDAEEVIAMPSWLASHADFVSSIAAKGRVGTWIAENLSMPFPRMVVAVSLVILAAFAITRAALRGGSRGFWLTAYLVALGMATLHVFVHVLQAVVTRGYIPGLAGAVLILLPFCLYVYRRLHADGVVTMQVAILAAISGIGLFLPTVMFFKIVSNLLPIG